MTDRELLELAAKAAGIKHEGVYFADSGLRLGERGNGYTLWVEWWNPLTDDGDALRLAVTVGMSIKIRLRSKDVRAAVPYMRGFQEFFNDNPSAATRRAVVRAAAEIGRAALAQEQGGSDGNSRVFGTP